jgi:hypothetical protein
MPEHTDKPERDTSPSGEISARQNEDGTYEIVAGDSSSANAVPENDDAKPATSPSGEGVDDNSAPIRSPITIALLVLTLVAAGGTVAYFASGTSGDSREQASDGEDPSFRPYAGDEAPPAENVEVDESGEEATAEADASGLDEDAGPKERKTEIIVLEEGVDEDEPAESAQADQKDPEIDPSKFRKIEMGPDTAARIRDSVRLKVDPAKLRDIKFTNGDIPEAEGHETRDRDKQDVDPEGASEGQLEDPVIE